MEDLVVVEVVVVMKLVEAGIKGNGGSGIVVVRYQIGTHYQLQKQLVVLLVSIMDKTIHTFTFWYFC